ncbi:SGNH/GDSL hydrolase family protein [Serratia marcescens]|nr:SGNH/GDSL hydrolase family protein [Serratia marcescens]
MTTPTNKPIPSNDLNDFRFNAEKVDEVVNSNNENYTDRFGVKRFTIEGIRKNIAPLGKRYDSLQQAIDAFDSEIQDGAYFFVRSSGDASLAYEYQRVGSNAVPTGESMYNGNAVSEINNRLAGGNVDQFLQSATKTGIRESVARTRVEGSNFSVSGLLESVTVFAEVSGAAIVKIVTNGSTSGTYSLVTEFPITLSVGENKFTSGVDFLPISVNTSQTIAVYSNVGRMSSSANGVGQEGSSYIFNGNLTGNNVAVTTTTNEMQLKAVVVTGTGETYEDISQKVVEISNKINGQTLSIGVNSPSATGTVETTTRTRILGDIITSAGYLSKVTVYAHTAGTAKIKVVKKVSDKIFSLISEFSVTCVSGVNEFVSGTHFENVAVTNGDSIAFYGGTARIEASPTGSGPDGVTLIYNGDLTGSNVTVVSTTNYMQLKADFSVGVSYDQLVDIATDAYATSKDVENKITSLPTSISDALRKSITTEVQKFTGTSIPPNWVTSGAVWSISDALLASGVGGATTVASFDKYSSMARKITRARIKMIDSSSRAGISFLPQESNRGTAVLINGSSGVFELNSYTGTALTLSRTTPLPSSIVAGREYLIEVRKVGISTIATFRDTVTGATTTINQSQGDGGVDAGAQHGKPGVMFISGSISVSRFEFVSGVQQNPAWIILGDSIVEGSNNSSDWSKMWGYLLESARGKGDTLIAARGGDETPNLLPRLDMDLNQFSPKYVIYEIGTNDANQAEWRVNTQSVINAIVARGATPILCTQVPRPAKQAQITAQNSDIRSRFFGDYDYIDLALAVSLNNAGVEYDPVYYQQDKVHLTVEGEAKLFSQVLADAPYLLD